MDERIDFDVNESLKEYLADPQSIHTPEADSSLVDLEQEPEGFSNAAVNNALNPILDAIAENPDALLSRSSFDTLQFLLKCAVLSPIQLPSSITKLTYLTRSSSLLQPVAIGKVLDIVVSGLAAETEIIHNETDDAESVFQHHKKLLEAYGFLLQWSISAIEAKAAEKSASASATAIRGRGGKGGKAKKDPGAYDSSGAVQSALDVMTKVMKLRLAKVFHTTSERDTFIGLFTRAVYLVLESETRVKVLAVRMHCFKVLCIAIKHHGHAYGTHRYTLLPGRTELTDSRCSNFHYSELVIL